MFRGSRCGTTTIVVDRRQRVNQQTHFIIFLRLAVQSQFIPLQNVMYFITLPIFLFVKSSLFI